MRKNYEQAEQASPTSHDRLVELGTKTIHRNGFAYEVTLIGKIDRLTWDSYSPKLRYEWKATTLKAKLAELEMQNCARQNNFNTFVGETA